MTGERTFFKIKIDIADIDNYYHDFMPCALIYECELIVDVADNNAISIKIFYEDREYLGEKISSWEDRTNGNFLKHIELLEVITPLNLISIDFLNYKCKGISSGSSFYEVDRKYVILKLTGVKRVFSSDKSDFAEFYLNDKGFNIAEMYYRYHTNFSPYEDFKWVQHNIIQQPLPFGEVNFRPEHHFYNSSGNGNSEVRIKKEPKVIVKHKNKSVSEINKHIQALCVLYSFYSQQEIDYSISRIYSGGELHIELRDVKQSYGRDIHGLFRWEFKSDPNCLILNVNSVHLFENLDFIAKVVYRYNYAMRTDGESRFMILYNVLEQIRNKYILDANKLATEPGHTKIEKVLEEHKFTISKTQTDKFIKEILGKILEIVDPEERQQFSEEIKFKVRPIKLTTMSNQFKSFFDYISIDPTGYALDFEEMKQIRNSIFHGNIGDTNLILLDKIIDYKCLPKFVGAVIIKYLGIQELTYVSEVNYQV